MCMLLDGIKKYNSKNYFYIALYLDAISTVVFLTCYKYNYYIYI